MNSLRFGICSALPVLVLAIGGDFVGGQTPADKNGGPSFTAEQRAALTALFEHGGIAVGLDERSPGRPVVTVDFAGHPEFEDAWLNQLRPFAELRSVHLTGTALTDAGLARLAEFKRLRTLDVRGTRVSAAGVAELRKASPELVVAASTPPFVSPQEALIELKKLGGILVHYDDRRPDNPVIMIDATNRRGFQDAWTSYFAAFPQLRQIGLSGVPLSDAALEPFPAIAELESLFLAGTMITDRGLAKLAGCKKLTYLNIEGTLVTPAGVAALRKVLPQLEVVVEPEKSDEPRRTD